MHELISNCLNLKIYAYTADRYGDCFKDGNKDWILEKEKTGKHKEDYTWARSTFCIDPCVSLLEERRRHM